MIYSKLGGGQLFVNRMYLVIFLTLLLVSCQREDILESYSAEEVARLVIEYQRSFNEKGLKQLLCENCITQPYNRVNIRKRDFAYVLEKKNVDFYDSNSQDFKDIKCILISQNANVVNLKCEGKIVLYKRDRSILQVTHVNKEVNLYQEGERFTICPPVCFQ